MLDKVFTSGMNKEMIARWNYIVNITDENEIKQVSWPIISSTHLEQIIELIQCFTFIKEIKFIVTVYVFIKKSKVFSVKRLCRNKI